MNFIHDQIEAFGSTVYFLEYGVFDPQDFMDQLTSLEREQFFKFNHPKRQCEFVATRILRHSIFGFKHIHYNAVGAPYIEDAGFISVSHSDHLIGIAVNKDFQIGFDLENNSDKAKRLHSKFLNQHEKIIFDLEDELEMTTCWSAKETLYKLAGRNFIDFKEELLLNKNDSDGLTGTIINPSETIEVSLHAFLYQNQIVTINKLPVVRK
ncbi:MAG: 4'-phosphopantetheinyl transferase superfamily protein [Crocinitomicaceae bacterium]|nr:4'-phosphopantetheinyl transferase superfamily protein [Crocinitomicaceae bacterium]